MLTFEDMLQITELLDLPIFLLSIASIVNERMQERRRSAERILQICMCIEEPRNSQHA